VRSPGEVELFKDEPPNLFRDHLIDVAHAATFLGRSAGASELFKISLDAQQSQVDSISDDGILSPIDARYEIMRSLRGRGAAQRILSDGHRRTNED
jgi:hypothetical protein